MGSSILNWIENKEIDLGQTEKYAAILGISPSKGARSPVLWNAAFKQLKIDAVMHPMDIIPENLEPAVNALRDDPRFIGGAVTMPYKVDLLPLLDQIEPQADAIGAINCIYRDGRMLVGTNTDGEGALWSLENEYSGSLKGKTVLIIGTGGAGMAVAVYLSEAIGAKGKLLLANRSEASKNRLAEKLIERCRVEIIEPWPLEQNHIKDVDILVNCTSIGFEGLYKVSNGYCSRKFYSPLGRVDEQTSVSNGDSEEKVYFKAAYSFINKNIDDTLNLLDSITNPFVFDIIYQPQVTMLLYFSQLLGYKTLNGLPMNLEQAVIAFDKATSAFSMRQSNCSEIREIMGKV